MTLSLKEIELIVGARQGNLFQLQEAIKKGANVDVRDRDDFTPLLWVSLRGDYEGVKALLDAGANPNLLGRHGTSTLQCSANGGYKRCVEALIQAGANPQTLHELQRDEYADVIQAYKKVNYRERHGAIRKYVKMWR